MKRSLLPKSLILSISLGFLFSAPASQALTLNDYLEQVQEENLGYRGQSEQSEAAQLRSREADLIFTPQLFAEMVSGHDGKPSTPTMYEQVKNQNYSLGVSQQFEFGLQTKIYYELNRTEFRNALPSINPAKYWDASPKIEFTMPLWGGGFGRTARANSEALRQQNLAERYASDSNAQNLLAGAEAAYWRLSAWQDVVVIQEQAADAARSILDYVTEKKRKNLGEAADVIQARALVEARTLELQMARNEAAEWQRAFNKFLNKEAQAPVTGLEKVDYKALEKLEVPQERPGSRADVQATEAQLTAAKALAEITKERNRPSLNVFGNYALNGRNEDFNESLKNAGKTEQDTAYIGLHFNMPLNIGAASDVKTGAARAAKAAEMNYQYSLYSQDQDWVNLVRNLTDARDNLRLLMRIEAAQQEKLKAERTRLRQGRTTTYQVLLFEQDYSQAAAARVKSAVGILGLQAQLKLYNNSAQGAK